MNTYTFTSSFESAFKKNLKRDLDEDTRALILMVCSNTEPHKKVDDKNRKSAYFTCTINEQLVTIVCDYEKKKIVTAIKEIYKRPQYGC